MKTHDFFYELPPELIAQTPLEKRDDSRLLLLDRGTGKTTHRIFSELTAVLLPGDCLVLNDSRVLPARLLGNRESGGAVELLLLSDKGEGQWECLARPGRKMRQGTRISFGGGELNAEITGTLPGGNRLVQFMHDGIFLEVLEKLGKTPLPPYIKEELYDSERYQTVYSMVSGSAAAPTAGLHFTNELLNALGSMGVHICYLTLHVGLGTFRPVKKEHLEDHKMHSEYCLIPPDTVTSVNEAKAEGRRVIACGTTVCRSLETAADSTGRIHDFSGFTDIFIFPGYEFKCVNGLITNFHLPESTLIMLVSAFAGRENVLRAYEEAVSKNYRFFSFGDAMFIV